MSSSDDTKCSHCDAPLNSTDDQPCPNCGQTGRTIHMVVKDRVNMRDDFVIQATSGKTNRSTIHADSRNETDTVKLQKLIINYVENKESALASYIEALVKDFNDHLCVTNQIYYRGVDISTKSYLRSNQIGPSPSSSDGRYNIDGEKCIYLIDTIDFLYPELNSSSILVQKFNIPIDTLKIADLSPNNKDLHNSLALAFDMAESGRTSSGYFFEEQLQSRGRSKYLVSQLISSFFKKDAWDGLYIPGVHGKDEHHYHNLVIFGAIVDKWENWAEGPYFSKTKK